ncbi:MAG: CHRD domain-containing protein [Acidimicrobiia bacterium]
MKTKLKLAAGISAAFAAGALFGPLNGAGAGHSNALLEADLRGRNEVAANATSSRNVGDPNGRGEAYVFGVDNDPTTLCYVLTVEKIAPATAAHIHEGAPGENGPVVANLAAPADGNAADCLTEGETGPGTTPKFPTGEAGIVQDILANPGDYYVNVHNAEHPGGAIRGQLRAQG